MNCQTSLENSAWLSAFEVFGGCEAKGIGLDWQIDGLDIWPLIKTLTVAPLLHSALDKAPRGSRKLHYKSQQLNYLRTQIIKRARSIWRGGDNPIVDSILRNPGSHSQLWCFGNTVPVLSVGGARAHVHFDPYRLYAESRGINHWSVFYNERSGALILRDLMIGPNAGIADELSLVDVAPWQGAVRDWVRQHAYFFFDNFDHVHADVPRLIEKVAAAIERTLAYRNAFRLVLESRKPRALLCFNYYQPIGWALSAAAREVGIPLYDIQHGAQGRFHHAYHWARVPEGGWNSTPQGYLLYGIPNKGDVIGGKCHPGAPSWYLWCRLAFGLEKGVPVPVSWETASGNLLKQARTLWAEARSRRVPWHLYASFADEAPERITRLQASLGDGARILNKRHPNQIRNGSYSLVEGLPLPCVLAAVDGLITGYSATILEAAKMNVPTYVFGGNAQKFYEGLPLHILDDRSDASIDALAIRDGNSADPEERLMACLAKTEWPSGWL